MLILTRRPSESIKINSEIDKDDIIAVMSLKDELVALGTAVMTTEQVMTENKGLCVKIDKVFMTPGTYPRQIIPKKE